MKSLGSTSSVMVLPATVFTNICIASELIVHPNIRTSTSSKPIDFLPVSYPSGINNGIHAQGRYPSSHMWFLATMICSLMEKFPTNM